MNAGSILNIIAAEGRSWKMSGGGRTTPPPPPEREGVAAKINIFYNFDISKNYNKEYVPKIL